MLVYFHMLAPFVSVFMILGFTVSQRDWLLPSLAEVLGVPQPVLWLFFAIAAIFNIIVGGLRVKAFDDAREERA